MRKCLNTNNRFLRFKFKNTDPLCFQCRERCKFAIHFQRGFSLVEILIAVGIMSIISLGIASMISDISRSQGALAEKLATIEAGNGISRAFADPAICGAQLSQPVNPPTVDLSPANVRFASISYPAIRLGLSSSSPLIVRAGESLPGFPAGKMKVQSITLKNIANISGNNFSGDLEVLIEPSTMTRFIKPFGVKNLTFTATPAPFVAATVTDCGSSGAAVVVVDSGWAANPTATCPVGTRLTGGSCDMNRGGDGREVNPRICAPLGNGYSCSEGNSGVCQAHALCHP